MKKVSFCKIALEKKHELFGSHVGLHGLVVTVDLTSNGFEKFPPDGPAR
jgi:hypothetical protein